MGEEQPLAPAAALPAAMDDVVPSAVAVLPELLLIR